MQDASTGICTCNIRQAPFPFSPYIPSGSLNKKNYTQAGQIAGQMQNFYSSFVHTALLSIDFMMKKSRTPNYYPNFQH